MKTYKKNYIGKGSQHKTMDIIKVTLKMDDLLKFQHEFNGNQYISFEVARMQNPDRFKRTHTAYVITSEKVQNKSNSPKKRGRKPKKVALKM